MKSTRHKAIRNGKLCSCAVVMSEEEVLVTSQ